MIAPLFIPDMDTLKSRLRLSAVDTGDSAAVVNATVEEVRIQLYEELGEPLVSDLVGLPRVENPTTEDGLKRLRAENIELLWVRMLLMQRLPTFYAQSFGQTRKSWNEEGITREARGSEYKRDLTNLINEIRDALAHLTGDETGEMLAAVILPDIRPPRPGESVFGIPVVPRVIVSAGVPVIKKLAPLIDTYVDDALSTTVFGLSQAVKFTQSAINLQYLHLEFDLSEFASIDDATLYFNVQSTSGQSHDWEIRRMTAQVLELESSFDNRNQPGLIAWGGGADGGFADTVVVDPVAVTGTVPPNQTVNQNFRFANLRLFALDAIANRSGKLQLFIHQTNITVLPQAYHSSRAGSTKEPKLWVTHTP